MKNEKENQWTLLSHSCNQYAPNNKDTRSIDSRQIEAKLFKTKCLPNVRNSSTCGIVGNCVYRVSSFGSLRQFSSEPHSIEWKIVHLNHHIQQNTHLN